MATFAVARLEDIEQVDDGRSPFHMVRHHFGITTFGVNAMFARAAGDQVINEHSESQPGSSEELYVVQSGEATFELDGETRDAPAGTFVYVQPGVKRSAVAREAGTVVLVIGAGPEGEPYQVKGWELFAPLFPLFQSGEYVEGAESARELIANNPPYGLVFYNTACFEARAGQVDEALSHLRRAIELSPDLAGLARDDEDLASLREKPDFAEIVG